MANSTALDVMRIALRQYAYKESPAGSNKTKYGKAYGADGVPWCAEYVWWSGEEAPGSNPIAKSYNAAYIEDLTVSNKGGKYILKQTANNDKKKEALPKYKFGDMISFNFNGGSSRAHTGLIIGRSGNSIYCMEGNTSFSDSGSQSNGGCVALRRRSYATGVCIVRPKYSSHKFHTPTKPYTGNLPVLPSRGWFKYGDKSEQVRNLQQALKWANGYDLKADSDFGGCTFAEVVIFEVANGLVPDGEFGSACRKKLKELIANCRQEASPEAPIVPQEDEKPKAEETIDNAEKHPKQFVPTRDDKCYDLSNWQGRLSVDYFKDIKKNGVKSVILRSSYSKLASPHRMYKDDSFDNNIKNAIEAGMHIGIYHFSSALNEKESVKEAEFCLSCIKPYMGSIDLPVAFDCEFGSTSDSRFKAKQAKSIGKTGMGKIIYAFTDAVKAAGYEPMIYANLSMFNNYLPADIYKKLKIWIAQYNSKCDYKNPFFMWQFTSNNGKLDENYFGSQDTKEADSTKAEMIVKRARMDSHPFGTEKSKYAYPGGSPVEQYKEDLQTAYGDRKGWGTQTKKGASCDVFVGTTLRASGVDKKFPRGLSEQVPYLRKSDGWKEIKDHTDIRPGDVIYQKYKTGGEHICICLTKSRVANAHYKKKTYPVREKFSSIVKSESKCKTYEVYRAV